MKIREYRYTTEGMGGGTWLMRVRDLPKSEQRPERAVEVPAETPETDWQPCAAPEA